jgi:hypothetical protein
MHMMVRENRVHLPEVLATLRRHRQQLQARGVRHVYVFGSLAREQAHEASDIDLALELEETARVGLLELHALQKVLSSLLKRKVDVISLSPHTRRDLRQAIMREGKCAF